MDMQLYARVLWRWKLVVVLGLLVAVALTFLSIYRVPSNGHLSARKHSEYVSYATLFVTQTGLSVRSARHFARNDARVDGHQRRPRRTRRRRNSPTWLA